MSAAVPQIFYNSPWPSPLYQTLNVLIDHYNDPGFLKEESIFSQPIFELLSTTAAAISNKPVVDDKELAFGLGKDLLQTSVEDDYQIVLNGTLRFRYTFDPNDTFSHTANSTFNKQELEKYVEAHKNKPPSLFFLQAEQDLRQIKTKPPELQAIEQLYTFLTGHSCTVNSEHFLFILLGIQQSNVTEIIERIKDEILKKFQKDFTHIQYVTPFINKIIFDIQCDQLTRRLEIRTRVKYHLNIITDEGNKQILFPFELTDIVYDLDLTNIENDDKPGLKLQVTPVQELFKLYRDFYNILKNVPNVIKNSTGEINYSVFSTALQQKIKYMTRGRGQAVEERMALKGFMGGKRHKTSRIRRVSKKKFYSYKRSRRQRKSKEKSNKISKCIACIHSNYKNRI
jgi:hypothetical protein